MGATILDVSEVLLELGLSSAVTDEERAVVEQSVRRAESTVVRHLRYDPVLRTRTEYYPQRVSGYQPREMVWESNDVEAYQRAESEASTSELQLQHLPIRSVTSLYLDYDGRSGAQAGAFAVSTLKAEGTDYWPNYDRVDGDGNRLCSDGVLRSLGSWPQEPGTVKVTYIAGYSPAELRGEDAIINAGPIIEALLLESCRRVRRMFALKKSNGRGMPAGIITSESLGDYSYSIDAGSANKMAMSSSGLMPESVELLSGFVNWGWSI